MVSYVPVEQKLEQSVEQLPIQRQENKSASGPMAVEQRLDVDAPESTSAQVVQVPLPVPVGVVPVGVAVGVPVNVVVPVGSGGVGFSWPSGGRGYGNSP